MWTAVLGWFWVLVGTLWVVRPGILRGWFSWSTGGKVKWLLWGFLFAFFAHLAGLAFQIHTVLLRRIGLTAVALTAVLLWAAQARARSQLRSWFGGIPLVVFRAVGITQIIFGTALLCFSRG